MKYIFRIFFYISFLLLLNSCKQNIQGIILDVETKTPIDSVAVLERNPEDSYPHPYTLSDKNGKFSFTKETRNSVLYFSKSGYEDLRVKFKRFSPLAILRDTIYLTKKR
ncbi:MAG: hypothetical protein ABI091_15500 [Ferruginibacter sp.]